MGYMRRFLSATRWQIHGAVQSAGLRQFLPTERRDDDLFVVEFPKSGITWLSFLMANVNVLVAGEQRHVTFFNIHDFIPDVQSGPNVTGPLASSLGYRCIKSHAPYVSRYRKIFYLVRDPRDTMVSYYAHVKGLGQWRGTLDEFVRHGRFGIQAWVAHVTGWLDGVQPAVRFALIRYEDLIADTACELRRLYRLLGIPVTDEMIAAAIERSSIEKMRNLESESSTGHPALRNQEFVRRGRPGGSREPLPEATRELIEREAGFVMEQLGYLRKKTSSPASGTGAIE